MATHETASTREVVASMLEDKRTVREIAQRLDLSTQAVYYHRDQIARHTAQEQTEGRSRL